MMITTEPILTAIIVIKITLILLITNSEHIMDIYMLAYSIV